MVSLMPRNFDFLTSAQRSAEVNIHTTLDAEVGCPEGSCISENRYRQIKLTLKPSMKTIEFSYHLSFQGKNWQEFWIFYKEASRFGVLVYLLVTITLLRDVFSVQITNHVLQPFYRISSYAIHC